jgi:hypothetical protein
LTNADNFAKNAKREWSYQLLHPMDKTTIIDNIKYAVIEEQERYYDPIIVKKYPIIDIYSIRFYINGYWQYSHVYQTTKKENYIRILTDLDLIEEGEI